MRQDSYVKESVEAILQSFVTSAIHVILVALRIASSTFMSVTRIFESGLRINLNADLFLFVEVLCHTICCSFLLKYSCNKDMYKSVILCIVLR